MKPPLTSADILANEEFSIHRYISAAEEVKKYKIPPFLLTEIS